MTFLHVRMVRIEGWMMIDPGLAPLSDAPSLEGLETDERVEAMVNWFYENFEDPVNETPYNGREGGYLYIHGGPYEAADYIIDAFPDATEDEHTAAIDQLDGDGPEWAPAGHRVLPPDDYDDQYSQPPLTIRLEALGAQLEDIKGHVGQMLALQRREIEGREGPPPAGHNNPPPDDEPDLFEVLDSVRAVEQELAKPDREIAADPEVLQVAEGRFRRLLNWLKELASKAPMALALGAAGGIGKWAAEYALAHQASISHALTSAADTMSIWVGAVAGLF